MLRSSAARATYVAAAAFLALVMGAAPVLGHAVHTSGSPGNYTVTDTETSPGAECIYPGVNQSNNDLAKIKIHAPLMYAKSGTQWVGWQFSVQHGTMAGSDAAWTTYYKSPVMKSTATTSQAGAFTTQKWIAGNHINRFWRIKLLMFWYKPGSKTQISGQVNWLMDWYTVTYPPNPDVSNPMHCLPGQ